MIPPRVEWGRRTNRWRRKVRRYFKPEHVEFALGVVYYESRGKRRAWNHDTDAMGLFQHKYKYWQARARKAGWPQTHPFDAEANIAVSAWLLYDGWHPETAPNWQHWVTFPRACEAVQAGRIV